jgi:hypothetical protein
LFMKKMASMFLEIKLFVFLYISEAKPKTI